MAQETKPRRDDTDWVDVVTKLGESLGLNPIRVRWKLEALRSRYRAARFRAGEQVEHIKYEHKICPECGRLNAGDLDRCARCGQSLGAHKWHVLQRLGLALPTALSMSALLGVGIVLVYGRVLLACGPGEGIMSINTATLLRFGGSWAPAVLAGNEWWRLGTCIFLHAGLWHLGFNLIALSQVGPPVENAYGRGRMLFYFMLTGLIASLASVLWGNVLLFLLTGSFGGVGDRVSIGASGAVMGLIGIAAGWGHREGTTLGRNIRNQMLKWLVYTTIFGFFIGADHVAHFAGFVAGGGIGLFVPPLTQKRTANLPLAVLQTTVGALAALACVALCVFAPASPAVDYLERQLQPPDRLSADAHLARLCAAQAERPTDIAWHETPSLMPWTSDQAVRNQQLASTCEVYRRDLQVCESFRAGGLEAVRASDPSPGGFAGLNDLAGILDDEQLDRYLRARCGPPGP